MERKIFQVTEADYDYWFIAPGEEELKVSLSLYGIPHDEGLEEVFIKELSETEADSILVFNEDDPENPKTLNQVSSEYGPEHIVSLIASS